MKYLTACLACSLAMGISVSALADTGEPTEQTFEYQSVIALKTDDFELMETDISSLAVGEAETIITESGKIIDLLRTADGVEVYVDGELLELNLYEADELHGAHEGLHKRIEVVCESADDCEEVVWIEDGSGLDPVAAESGDASIKVIRHRIEIQCDDGEDCASSEDALSELGMELAEGAMHIVRLHEDGANAGLDDEAKIIVIKKTPQD